jgi:phage-related protein
MDRQEGWRVERYTDPEGRIPVDRFLRDVRKAGPAHLAKVERQVRLLEELGLGLGREHIARLRTRQVACWELRATFQRNAYRITFYNPEGRTLVLLHGFLKKTDAVPKAEIERAERYATDDRRRRR